MSLPLQSSVSDEPQPHHNQMPAARKQPLFRTKSTTFNCKTDSDTKTSCIAENMDSCCSRSCASTGGVSSSHVMAHSQQPYNYRMMYPMGAVPMNQSDIPPQAYLPTNNRTVEASPSVNLHRKLQRELSINPTCDPRIYHMQRQLTSPESHHMPASRHYSYQDANYLSAHSNVTRISSAPPANPPYTVSNECAHGSNSDPQLNLSIPSCVTGFNTGPVWSPVQQAAAVHNYPMMSSNIEESRRKLHYHLASIFPEEQVDAAMRYYPNETNPQKICAAILSMFSSKP